MIRALKGTSTLTALVTLGCLLHWMTAGSITGLRTNDFDSLTVAAVSAVAWIAYVWLALAVVLTALEQLPGVLGTLSGAIAHRITTQTARTLLRTALGAAALTPLALPTAQATSPTPLATTSMWRPTAGPTIYASHPTSPSPTTRASRPSAPTTANLATPRTTTAGLPTGPGRDVWSGLPHQTSPGQSHAAHPDLAGVGPSRPDPRLSGPTAAQSPARDAADRSTTAGLAHQAEPTPPNRDEVTRFRAVEPGSQLHLSGTDSPSSTTNRKTPPDPTRVVPPNRPTRQVRVERGDGSTGGARVGVPDRPAGGATPRYTRLRPSAPTVVVREGDSLWRITARELGPTGTAESIAARCQAWYSANRHLIGPNPNLILPGQVLRVPPAHSDPDPPEPPQGAAR